MEKFSFFNDVNDDRVYYAEDWARHLKKYFTNGIFNNELNVVSNNDMTITIKEGDANIEGYRYTNTGDLVKTIDNADGTLNRIDNVVLRLDLTNRLISAQIIKGTFADKPVEPELVRTSTIYDLRIAKISIPAGTTTITQDLITDTRFITSDCGNVISTVQTPDTENLFIQMQTLFEKQINELNNNFEIWFDSIKNQLDSDAAGNLQNQINNLNSNKVDNAKFDLDSNNLQLLANGKNVGDSVHIPTGITDTATGEKDLKIVNNRGVVKFSLEGKTEQKSYTGKNILPHSLSQGSWNTTSTNTRVANYSNILIKPGTYTFSTDIDLTNYVVWVGTSTQKFPQTNWNIVNEIKSWSAIEKITFTIEKESYFLVMYRKKDDSTITPDEIKDIKQQLEIGPEATEFEPYVGETASPNPAYPQEIENIKGAENLLNLPDGTYTDNGVTAVVKGGIVTLNGTSTSNSFINIPYNYTFLANKNYTLSANNVSTLSGDNYVRLNYGTAVYFPTRLSSVNAKYTSNFNENTTVNTCVIRTESGKTYNNFVIKPMLVEGSIPHDFVLSGTNYLQLNNKNENTFKVINIDLKGNKLCSNKDKTIKDELLVENGIAKIYKKYGEYAFTGNESFGFADKGARIMSNTGRISQLKNVYIPTPQSSSNITPSFCTHYTVDGQGNVVKGSNKFGFSQYDNDKFIYFPADYSTIDEFKAKLKSLYDAGTPVIIQYPLAEPEIIDLGEVDFDLIENSTLTCEEDLKSNMSIKYYTDSTVVDLSKKVENKQNVILHGATAPTNDLGEDGDIYLQHN